MSGTPNPHRPDDPHGSRDNGMGNYNPSASEGHLAPPDPLSAVPLFPLPNIVLFPRAVLPLHIFEERYKTMTADALAGPRQIAMALLRPGWEKNYYQAPAIDPVVCVGTILTHEKLADGKYNFLLQGKIRARVVEEHKPLETGRPYRLARLEPLIETPVLEIDLLGLRQRLGQTFASGPLAATRAARQFVQFLAGTLPTADVADLAAFNLLEDVALKQSLLADGDVRRRIDRTIRALDALEAPAPPDAVVSHSCRISQNPSMN